MKNSETDEGLQGRWKSAAAEARYRELDAYAWARATGPSPEALDVSTDFGPTRVHRWPGDGPAVVLLHGMTDTSLRWMPFARRLDDYDVYAVDTMGDIGASVHEVAFAGVDDFPRWLGQAIDGLGLAAPHLVGQSMGGWIALAFVAGSDGTAGVAGATGAAGSGEPTGSGAGGADGEATGRGDVASLTLFDPVGVVRLRMGRFLRWGLATAVGSYAPAFLRPRLGRRLNAPLLDDKAEMRLALHAARHHPVWVPPLPVFSDEALASIDAPVRALLGARTSFFDTELLVERLTTHVPDVEVRVLADGGHQFTLTHFEESLSLLRSTLAGAHR
ncbi:MAG: alpha/beta hydrolase [Actinomycetota bacterium]